jgi:uncharacterized delta-60 repeat protein
MKKILFYIQIMLTCTIITKAQVTFDNTFNSTGYIIDPINPINNDWANCSFIQPDGQILLGGMFADSTGQAEFCIARYNSSGSPDLSFGVNGHTISRLGIGEDIIYGITMQTDGKIIAVGRASIYLSSDWDVAVVRYNDNGTEDTTFGTDGKTILDIGGADDQANSVAIDANGNIVVGVTTDPGTGFVTGTLLRLNSNGTLDHSFGNGGYKQISTPFDIHHVNSVILQPDGKIVVGGAEATSGNWDYALWRLQINGELDNSFGINGKVTTDVSGGGEDLFTEMALQMDGKILLAGNSDYTVLSKTSIVRYDTNGFLDTSFGSNGIFTTHICSDHDYFRNMLLQPDGNILITGDCQNIFPPLATAYVAGISSSGTIDSSFNSTGIFTFNVLQTEYSLTLTDINLQPDGKIILSGYHINDGPPDNYTDFLVIRLTYPSVGKENIYSSHSFNVYPNPASNNFYIHYSDQSNTCSIMQIHDLLGEEVLCEQIRSSDNTIDISGLKKGIYFVSIILPEKNQVSRKKLIINR